MIKVILNTLDKDYKSEGETVLEALTNLPLDWTMIKAKGVVTLSEGKKKVEKLFYLIPLRALFASKSRRAGYAKQLESLLKAKVAKDE